MAEFIEKIKERWGVSSIGGLFLILFLFAITGITTLFVRHFLFDILGITAGTDYWIQVIAWIAIVFPSYQVLFLLFGFLLGQFEFVYNFEKRSFKRIKSLFVKNQSEL